MNHKQLTLYWIKARVALRDLGAFHLVRRSLEESLLKHLFFVRQFIIYEKQLTDLDDINLSNPDFEFSFISLANDDILRQIEEQSGLSREMVSEMLKDGSECLVAMDGETLAGYNLVSYGTVNVHYLERHMKLSKSEAWSDQIFTALPYRRSGVAIDLRQIMFHHLGMKGYTKFIGGYLPYNTRPGMLARKLGFIEKEKVTLVKIFRQKIYRVHKYPPPYATELSHS
jgi:hypothetical protein